MEKETYIANVSYRERLNTYGEYIVTSVTVQVKGYPKETFKDSEGLIVREIVSDYAAKYDLVGHIQIMNRGFYEGGFEYMGKLYVPCPWYDEDLLS